MKKSVLILFAVGLLGLSACGKSGGKNMTLDKTGSSVLTPEFVKVNIEAQNQNAQSSNIPHPQSILQKTFDSSYSIYSKGNGIIVIRNSSGYYGFYSTYLGKFIIEPCLNSAGYTMNVNMIGSVAYVYNDNTGDYLIFDGFGNFFDLTYSQIQDIYGITSRIVYDDDGNKLVVATIRSNSGGYDPISYIYSENGTASLYNGQYDDNEDPNSGGQINIYADPEQGDLYKRGWMPLDEYGLKGYSLVQAENGFCTIFDGNTARSSFYLPNIGSSLVGVFNKKLLTQQTYQMPDDAEDYDYSYSGTKYSTESYFIDIESGKKEKLNFNVLFSRAQPLYNTRKEVEFYQVTYQEITDKKALGNQFTKIIDGSFAVRDDVSGANVFSYEKLNYEGYEYFFNYDNKVLYNSQLRPMTFLNGLSNVTLAKGMGVITARSNSTSKFGVVAPNGTVLVPFDYDNIYSAYAENGTMLMSKDGDGYRYTNGYISQVASNVTNIGPNIFKGTNGYYAEFFSTRESLLTLDTDYYTSISSNYVENLLGKYSVTLISASYRAQGYINVFSSETMNLRSYNMSLNYQERRNNQQQSGSSSSNAMRLNEGSMQYLYPNTSDNNRSYFYIYCNQSGTHYFYTSHPIAFDSSYYSTSPEYMDSYSYYDSPYNYRYEVYLMSGYNYGFYMSIGSSNSIGYVRYEFIS